MASDRSCVLQQSERCDVLEFVAHPRNPCLKLLTGSPPNMRAVLRDCNNAFRHSLLHRTRTPAPRPGKRSSPKR